MTKAIIKRKTISNSIKNKAFKNLSIQFSLDGFSFRVADNQQKITHFSEVVFNETLATPQDLLSKIEAIFKTDEQLQQDFSTVTVIHKNTLSTLVPTDYFDKNQLKNYLDYTIKTLQTDFITFDDLTNVAAKNVYIPYVNINNYIFQHFGEFEYKHYTSVFIDKLIKSNTSLVKKMFVQVSKNHLDILVLENKQLLFSNSFAFYTQEDFIYYILFTAEQLKLDTEKFVLTFLGDIKKDSEIYKIAYNYVRNIDFFESKNTYFNTQQLSKHNHFILLG